VKRFGGSAGEKEGFFRLGGGGAGLINNWAASFGGEGGFEAILKAPGIRDFRDGRGGKTFRELASMRRPGPAGGPGGRVRSGLIGAKGFRFAVGFRGLSP